MGNNESPLEYWKRLGKENRDKRERVRYQRNFVGPIDLMELSPWECDELLDDLDADYRFILWQIDVQEKAANVKGAE